MTTASAAPTYRRILLKLSGEVFQDPETGQGIDPAATATVARRLKSVVASGVQLGIVIGGGNIFRGLAGAAGGTERNTGDYMGMLATVINGLALQNALEQCGVDCRVQTALEIQKIAEPFGRARALEHLAAERVVIFAAGTGNPFFSTDTAAALRASEIGADVLFKATKVDGVYSADPLEHPDAVRYEDLSYAEAIGKSLKVMDAAAFALCMENRIPIVVFDFFQAGSLESAAAGRKVGTLVHNG